MRTGSRSLGAMSLFIALAACNPFKDELVLLKPPASIAAPTLRPFADGVNWATERDIVFHLEAGAPEVRVPAGFVTDLASIPKVAQIVRSRVGTYSRASILHDWLYWTGSCSRDESDEIFLKAMKSSGSSERVAGQIYAAVSRFGGTAYDTNAKERAAGERRFVPLDKLGLLDDHGWETVGDRKGVREMLGHVPAPGLAARPAWCDLGKKPEAPLDTGKSGS